VRGGGEAEAVEEQGGEEDDDSLGEGGEHARTTGDPSERERTHDAANEMTGAQASHLAGYRSAPAQHEWGACGDEHRTTEGNSEAEELPALTEVGLGGKEGCGVSKPLLPSYSAVRDSDVWGVKLTSAQLGALASARLSREVYVMLNEFLDFRDTQKGVTR
jgi:hypothetical protein